jgi:hypothetical protein
MGMSTEAYAQRLEQRRVATNQRQAQREGWPDIPAPDKREAYFKRKMKGRRYDDPGQMIIFKTPGTNSRG